VTRLWIPACAASSIAFGPVNLIASPQRIERLPRGNPTNPIVTSIYPDTGFTGTTIPVVLMGENLAVVYKIGG